IINKVNSKELVTDAGFVNGELHYTMAKKLSVDLDNGETPIMVMIFHDLSHEYQQVIFMILFTFIIALLFSGVVLWFISKKITAPLRDMNDIARSYAKGDFSKTGQIQSYDEIGQLAKSLNYMSNERDQLETRRRQFISN